jgi:UDP-N-acetyl-D-glucosamine dehydrogenase
VSGNSLEQKLRSRSAKVAIVGLGYAGLPMAVEIARAGFPVVGYDVDDAKVTSVNAGHSPVSNVPDADVAPLRAAGVLVASGEAAVLGTADVAIICVPTPLTAEGEPDMRFVLSAGRSIAEHLHRDLLVVLQSTCGPGTTAGILGAGLQQATGLRPGEDFHLVFAPERIDPGNTRYTVTNTPKLVGGVSPESTRLACLLFEAFIDDVVPVSSPDVAEMAKLVENTFRFINISFANEMALLCDKLGVNVWEVIEAAKTKPFAFMPHHPSAGVGGHCIPVVPFYLEAAAREHGMSTELIRAADRVNRAMPVAIVDKLEQALEARGKPLLDASVLLVGVTYKPDIADIRESAALRVLEAALARGARVAYHDPLIPSLELGGEVVESVPLTVGEVRAADAVLLLTPHTTIDYELIVREAALVVDTHPGLAPRSAPHVVNVWVPGSAAPSGVGGQRSGVGAGSGREGAAAATAAHHAVTEP